MRPGLRWLLFCAQLSWLHHVEAEQCFKEADIASFKIPTNAAMHWGRDHPDERLDPAVNDGHYGLKSCQVPKVMSTMMTFVMCDVYHAYHGDKADSGHDIRGDCTEWHEQNRELRGKPSAWHAAQPPVHFAVSREPISRFVSGYMALCMQWNDCAGMGVHDFAQALYAAFRKRVPRLRTRGKNGRILKHFAPQTWYCNKPNLYRFKYSANTTQMADEFVKVLQLAKVPAKIQKQIHSRVTDEPANFGIHSDNKKKAMLKEIYSNCDTLRSLVGLYYDDFIELGFPIPTIANSTTSEAQKKIEPEVKVNGHANEALQKMMPLLVPQTTTVTSKTIKDDLKMIAESNAAFDDDMKAAAFAAPTLEIDRKRGKKHRKRDGVFEKLKRKKKALRGKAKKNREDREDRIDRKERKERKNGKGRKNSKQNKKQKAANRRAKKNLKRLYSKFQSRDRKRGPRTWIL